MARASRWNAEGTLEVRVLAWSRGHEFTSAEAVAMFGPTIARVLARLKDEGKLVSLRRSVWRARQGLTEGRGDG